MTATHHKPSSAPIFIGGPDRCGKTLLAAMLGSHPDIAVPIVGSNMWTFFYGQCGDLADDAALDACIERMLAYKHVAFLEPDSERIRRDARAGPRTYGRLFALFQEQFAERADKPRWGDQTGLVERYASEIFEAYPGARMIHMVRDPRDRYQASLALWPDGRGGAGGATARWRYSMALAARNRRRFGDRYRILRYEDLVSEPETVLRGICDFIGEPFDPAMLRMSDAPSTFIRKLAAGGPIPEDTAQLVSAEHVGDFRGAIDEADIAFIELLAGHRMEQLGYELERPAMAPSDRLRFLLLDVPRDLLRFAAWLGFEQLQHHLPGLIGRTPMAAKMSGR
jgi:hypothetical protein